MECNCNSQAPSQVTAAEHQLSAERTHDRRKRSHLTFGSPVPQVISPEPSAKAPIVRLQDIPSGPPAG